MSSSAAASDDIDKHVLRKYEIVSVRGGPVPSPSHLSLSLCLPPSLLDPPTGLGAGDSLRWSLSLSLSRARAVHDS